MNMEFKRKLPAPEEVINMYPLTEEMKKKKAETMPRYAAFSAVRATDLSL